MFNAFNPEVLPGIRKVFYMDSDLIVLRSLDHLFDLIGDGEQHWPCALTPLSTKTCRDNPQWGHGLTPKANTGVWIMKPSADLFASAMERTRRPFKYNTGSQDVLKELLRCHFGVHQQQVAYSTQNDLERDLVSLRPQEEPNPSLHDQPPQGGPAWAAGVLRGMTVERRHVTELQKQLSRGRRGKLAFQAAYGRRSCACLALKHNCKMDADELQRCANDRGAEHSLPGAEARERSELVVRHWSGSSKPWAQWNRRGAKDSRGRLLSKAQKVGVRLWWQYHAEMRAYVKHSNRSGGR